MPDTLPPPFLPVPQIPAGMDPNTWKASVDALAAEGERIGAELAKGGTGVPGPGSGFGAASSYRSYSAFLEQTYGLTQGEADATASLMYHYAPTLASSLSANLKQNEGLATTSSIALDRWLTDQGFTAVADVPAWSLAVQRGQAAMITGWADLTVGTQRDIAHAISTGIATGQSPAKVGKKVGELLEAAGVGSYQRGLLIARTEMQDAQANARLADMRAQPDVFAGWKWVARPDACPVCQIQHARLFDLDTPMNAHHMCRCSMEGVFTDEEELVRLIEKGTGEYAPGEARSWDDILDPPPWKKGQPPQAGIPKSWRKHLPDDPRDLVDLHENGGWRDSWGLTRPPGAKPGKKGPKPPARHKGGPLPDVPIMEAMRRYPYTEYGHNADEVALLDHAGYAGRPSVLGKSDFDNVPGPEYYRGVRGKYGIPATEMQEQLMHGPYWYGNGIAANGTYIGTLSEAAMFSGNRGFMPWEDDSAMLRVKLHPEANVITINEVRSEMGDAYWVPNTGRPDYTATTRWCIENGYDAIDCRSEGEYYGIAVLNRTALVIEQP